MSNSVRLGSRFIDQNSSPYIIAEIGVNHEGDLNKAKKLIELAKEGGADAAKFQSYKANTLASINSPSYWDTSQESTKSQYELFKKYDNFEPKDYIVLSEYCKRVGIDFLSTPFDDISVEFLDPIVPFFKIASADITNIPFLRKVASKSKPVILSTGASTLSEIDLAIDTIKKEGCTNIILLHCILNYPTANSNANLRMIQSLIRAYPNHLIGYSDHTLPDDNMTTLLSSYLLGSKVIEKHFTDNKNLKGNDHYHSMDLKDLSTIVNLIKKVNLLLGDNHIKLPIDSEHNSRLNARRSIIILKDLPIGHIISDNDITYKRPGFGISPLHWDNVLGSKLNKPKKRDEILYWSDLSD